MNTRKNIFRLAMVFIMVSLIVSILNQAPLVSAIASQATLKKSVTVSLINKQLIPSDNGKIALVTLKIDNQSSAEIELIDYWARINGKSTNYITKLAEHDANKQTVLPGNQQYLTYYANVSKNEQLVDINVDVIEWDFSYSSYESIVGNLKISEINQPKVNETVNIRYGDLNLASTLENQFLYENAQFKVVSYRVKLSNLINRAADITTFTTYAIINNSEVYEADTVAQTKQINSKGEVYLYGQVNVPKNSVIDAMSIALVDKRGEDIYPLIVFPVDTLIEESSQKLIDKNTVNIGNQQYTVKGNGIELSAESKRSKITIPLSLTNVSANPGTIDDLTFQLKTKSGLIYPLSIEESEVKTLLPEIEELITVSGYIPNEQVVIDSQLLVGLTIDSKNIVVKTLLLEDVEIDDSISINDFVVSGQKISLERLSRMPNGEQDILVAEFQILNTSSEAKKPVELAGEFVLDGVKIDSKETKVIRMNSSLTIQPNETERVVLYINIPFTQIANKYSMNLTVNNNHKKSLNMTLNGPNKILASNEKYNLKTLGKRGEVSYFDSHIYSGSTDDLFVVQLLVKNIEKRNVLPSMLNGYIQTNTGEIYQLTFEKYEESLMPNGTKLITGSTTVPRNLVTKDLSVHFGEQLNDEQVIYIDPVYIMHKNIPVVRTHLMEMLTLNDKKFWVWSLDHEWTKSNGQDIDGFNLEFDYQVDEVIGGIGQLGERQLMIEYQDLTLSAMRTTKLFNLNDGSELQVGRGKIQMSYMNPTVDYHNLPNGYSINVYEVYKGYKRLLTSQQFTHQY